MVVAEVEARSKSRKDKRIKREADLETKLGGVHPKANEMESKSNFRSTESENHDSGSSVDERSDDMTASSKMESVSKESKGGKTHVS